MSARLTIAIDGTAASGKGTLAHRLASHYGLPHLDTGLLYRAVGLAVLDQLDADDLEARAVAAARTIDATKLDPSILGTAQVAIAAAKIARIEPVRAALRQFQLDFAAAGIGAVIDGRDIGTRICPDATAKLFVTAAPEVRARRRTDQLQARGTAVEFEEILAQINTRDTSDRANPAGAFFQAEDAHLLDTSKLGIEAAFSAALEIVESAIADRNAPQA